MSFKTGTNSDSKYMLCLIHCITCLKKFFKKSFTHSVCVFVIPSGVPTLVWESVQYTANQSDPDCKEIPHSAQGQARGTLR